MSIRLLIADDHKIMREGLKALVAKEPDITVVGEAENGKTTVNMVQKLSPNVVVLDIPMPALNGIEAARSLKNTNVSLYQAPELVPDAVLEASGAKAARKVFGHIPVIEPAQLAEADAIIFGTPTRFGNMCDQMRNFLDQTGELWMQGALIGKIGSVFARTGTQHGGQETTITSFYNTLIHLGMIVVGVPYSEQGLLNMTEISGGTPYGATTLAGADGSRKPSENELNIARFQGQHVAALALKLKGN